MTEVSFLADQLEAGFDGEPWHGPSFHDAIEGITAEQAAARPVAGAHSVWDLVHHIAGWDGVVVQRINGVSIEEPEEGDFPPADTDQSDDAWRALLAKLDASHARLVETIRALPDAELDRQTPGRKYPLRFTLYGTLQHLAYHAAQIVILRKGLAA